MPISILQIQERLKARKKIPEVQRAISHERRINFHAQTSLNISEAGVNAFLGFVKSVLPNDKYVLFCKLFRAPIVTTGFIKKVFEAHEKVFEGKDTIETVEFSSKTASADYDEFAKELNVKDFFRTKGFGAMKTGINSILVVDLPEAQTTERPEPYFYLLPVTKVLDFEMADETLFDWLAFELEEDRLAVFDQEYFRVFQKDKKQGLSSVTLISEVAHNIGITPARTLWTKPVNQESNFVKCSPLTDQLEKLDWLAFFSISKKVLDMYAAYPVQWGFETDCEYTNGNMRCESGFLKYTHDEYSYNNSEYGHGHEHHIGEGFNRHRPETFLLNNDGTLKTCPVCSESRLMGAGSFVEVPYPDEGEKAAIPPVGSVPVDRNSLDYNVEEIVRLESELYTNITGFTGDPLQKEAVNEIQVAAAFESRTNVLINLKQDFEAVHSWLIDVLCKLRYADVYEGNEVNYGTKFYLFSPEVLLSFYEDARKNELNDTILDTLYTEYLQAKYRTDAMMFQRMKILADLEPFRHSKKSEVFAMYEAGKIMFEVCMLKTQFSDLIARFERENGSIIEFGSNINYADKIKKIVEVMNTYIIENKPPEPKPVEGILNQ